jgi:putative radical SAM enzyme (TIGR03279 family)
MMNAIVKSITSKSPASGTIISPGDALLKINGSKIHDVLDYMFFSYEKRLLLELINPSGKLKFVKIIKPEGADIGLEFETYLMDEERSCANRCIFCFIDQLPKGMRKSLYYKDDDVRLSFLQGNYVTLTNLQKSDLQRIIKLRISPINVSVHSTDPKLRAMMLGGKSKCDGIEALKELAEAEITLNCQIVCCPDVNDGSELDKTIRDLMSFGECINSVSIVPVGLTKHRDGLPYLRPFDKKLAFDTIKQADAFGEICHKNYGKRIFYCADELYLTAELALPDYEYYDEFYQLENGVGMMRLFISEFENELENMPKVKSYKPFTIITGKSAAAELTNLLKTAQKVYDNIIGDVLTIKNDFFGDTVTVSGLITAGDIISQFKAKKQTLAQHILIPKNMLRAGEEIFLDDITVKQLAKELGVSVRIVAQDGADFLRAVLGY